MKKLEPACVRKISSPMSTNPPMAETTPSIRSMRSPTLEVPQGLGLLLLFVSNVREFHGKQLRRYLALIGFCPERIGLRFEGSQHALSTRYLPIHQRRAAGKRDGAKCSHRRHKDRGSYP